jgi:hypothetical protein
MMNAMEIRPLSAPVYEFPSDVGGGWMVFNGICGEFCNLLVSFKSLDRYLVGCKSEPLAHGRIRGVHVFAGQVPNQFFGWPATSLPHLLQSERTRLPCGFAFRKNYLARDEDRPKQSERYLLVVRQGPYFLQSGCVLRFKNFNQESEVFLGHAFFSLWGVG